MTVRRVFKRTSLRRQHGYQNAEIVVSDMSAQKVQVFRTLNQNFHFTSQSIMRGKPSTQKIEYFLHSLANSSCANASNASNKLFIVLPSLFNAVSNCQILMSESSVPVLIHYNPFFHLFYVLMNLHFKNSLLKKPETFSSVFGIFFVNTANGSEVFDFWDLSIFVFKKLHQYSS